MWNDEKQQRFNDLRRRAQAAALPSTEQQELDALFEELDADEWAALRPGLERMDARATTLCAEIARIRAQNAELEALAERYERLVAQAKAQLDVLTREQEALRREYERIGPTPARSPVGSS